MNQVMERSDVTAIAHVDERPRALAVQHSPSSVDAGFALVQAAVARGASMDELTKLMELRAKLRAEAAEEAFVGAMASFKAEPLVIVKRKSVGYETKDGDWVGYQHAELSDVTAVVCPAMGKHGLSHRWDVQQAGDVITVTCIVTHRSGHSITVSMNGRPDNSGKKNAIQQIASTVSYLQRYTLMAATGTAAGGMDDDGRGAGEPGIGATPAPPPAAASDYPDDKFQQYLPDWRASIKAGKTTADKVIAKVESKARLSDEQKAQIRQAA
ncbi:ERF family protein [Aquincola tertiaricarbonis]|uniref:ERF family protein n=1 Tax=Aquincola tertiaricarbonis TaxID=391953 RepID=A0ABY4S5U0_AQUTE|nr:ERF family protein [Aquincola tertiaricarbonis]URI08783.1 ERF family protein [Aquincola tertiaricarbonis]